MVWKIARLFRFRLYRYMSWKVAIHRLKDIVRWRVHITRHCLSSWSISADWLGKLCVDVCELFKLAIASPLKIKLGWSIYKCLVFVRSFIRDWMQGLISGTRINSVSFLVEEASVISNRCSLWSKLWWIELNAAIDFLNDFHHVVFIGWDDSFFILSIGKLWRHYFTLIEGLAIMVFEYNYRLLVDLRLHVLKLTVQVV